MKSTTLAVFSVACLAGSVSPLAFAASSDEWQFEVTPYLFAAGLKGDVGVKGYKTSVDMSFSDIWDDLDMAFMAVFTARKGPWIFGLETFYMEMEDSASGSVSGPGGVVSINGKLDATMKQYLYQGTVGYRVLDGKTKVDVLGALRYNKLEADMKVKYEFDPPIFSGKKRASGSESWTDAVIGINILHQLTDNIALQGYADAGGSSDDTTFHFIAGVNWEFKKDYVARFGYRYLSWDYENKGTVWDTHVDGPYMGLGIKF